MGLEISSLSAPVTDIFLIRSDWWGTALCPLLGGARRILVWTHGGNKVYAKNLLKLLLVWPNEKGVTLLFLERIFSGFSSVCDSSKKRFRKLSYFSHAFFEEGYGLNKCIIARSIYQAYELVKIRRSIITKMCSKMNNFAAMEIITD